MYLYAEFANGTEWTQNRFFTGFIVPNSFIITNLELSLPK